MHPNCRCDVIPLESIEAGNATNNGDEGADYWLKYFVELPEYYVTKSKAKILGWRQGKSPANYIPGKMIMGGIYHNKNSHLPDAPERIWYEADINYYEGRRNRQRVLWSNDGLLLRQLNNRKIYSDGAKPLITVIASNAKQSKGTLGFDVDFQRKRRANFKPANGLPRSLRSLAVT